MVQKADVVAVTVAAALLAVVDPPHTGIGAVGDVVARLAVVDPSHAAGGAGQVRETTLTVVGSAGAALSTGAVAHARLPRGAIADTRTLPRAAVAKSPRVAAALADVVAIRVGAARLAVLLTADAVGDVAGRCGNAPDRQVQHGGGDDSFQIHAAPPLWPACVGAW